MRIIVIRTMTATRSMTINRIRLQVLVMRISMTIRRIHPKPCPTISRRERNIFVVQWIRSCCFLKSNEQRFIWPIRIVTIEMSRRFSARNGILSLPTNRINTRFERNNWEMNISNRILRSNGQISWTRSIPIRRHRMFFLLPKTNKSNVDDQPVYNPNPIKTRRLHHCVIDYKPSLRYFRSFLLVSSHFLVDRSVPTCLSWPKILHSASRPSPSRREIRDPSRDQRIWLHRFPFMAM